jgi:hypothetical protein
MVHCRAWECWRNRNDELKNFDGLVDLIVRRILDYLLLRTTVILEIIGYLASKSSDSAPVRSFVSKFAKIRALCDHGSVYAFEKITAVI